MNYQVCFSCPIYSQIIPVYIYMLEFFVGVGNFPNCILGKIPTATEGHWDGSSSNDYDAGLGSSASRSSQVYTPTSYLIKMVEKFKEGDNILDGKN